MRHGKKFNHLGRTASHRKAMLSNMATSLILHKRINTTTAKAKALRKYIEPLLTKAKSDTTHSRRTVFSHLQDKEAVKELFGTVAEKISERPGGYTRIIKTGIRLGDNADMCMMELVDFNELLLQDATSKAKTTRRSRRGKKASAGASDSSAEVEETTSAQDVQAVEAEATQEIVEELIDEVAELKEEVTALKEEIDEAKSEDESKDETSSDEEKKDSK